MFPINPVVSGFLQAEEVGLQTTLVHAVEVSSKVNLGAGIMKLWLG